jgi:hypothetical protein
MFLMGNGPDVKAIFLSGKAGVSGVEERLLS